MRQSTITNWMVSAFSSATHHFRNPVLLHSRIAGRTLGVEGHHCFFGYYDVTPFDKSGSRLLAGLRSTALGKRAAGTPLQVGYFDLRDAESRFFACGETRTWCWQQSARLQWLESFGRDCII